MMRFDGWDLVLVLILDNDLPHLPLMRQFSSIGYYTYLQLQRHYSKDETTENLSGYVELVHGETPVTYQSDSKLVIPPMFDVFFSEGPPGVRSDPFGDTYVQ